VTQAQPGKNKIFIVTPGRAGSTLFCSILAHAGADFGMKTTEEWDVRAGGYEHVACYSAMMHSRRALELKPSSKISAWAMLLRKYHRLMAKGKLSAILKKADYIKSSDSDLVRWSRGLGYQPSVLVLYRSFDRYCVSNYLRSGGNYSKLLSHYADSIETGLLAMATFGGCVVCFDEVIDPHQTSWAHNVSRVTGLDAAQLLAYRDKVVKPSASEPNPLNISDPRLTAIEQAIESCKNKVFTASAQAGRGI